MNYNFGETLTYVCNRLTKSTFSQKAKDPGLLGTVSYNSRLKPVNYSLKKKNFMAPFYGWGSTASRLEPLRGGSLLLTTKFPEIPGTHFIDLGRMKG